MGEAANPIRAYIARSLGGSSGSAGRARRIKGGFLYVTAASDVGFDKAQRYRGRFTNVQIEVRRVNERLASELVDLMLQNLERSIVRPNVSTRRLATALADPRNRRFDTGGFDVGKISYLDNSAAKYWRAIELGTRHFIGKKITGVFGATLTGAYGGRGEYGPYPLAGPGFTAINAGQGGRLLPMSRKAAAKLLGGRGGVQGRRGSGGRAPATRGIIKRPIEAHRYMHNAYVEFDMRARADRVVAEVFTASGLPIPTKGRKPYPLN